MPVIEKYCKVIFPQRLLYVCTKKICQFSIGKVYFVEKLVMRAFELGNLPVCTVANQKIDKLVKVVRK